MAEIKKLYEQAFEIILPHCCRQTMIPAPPCAPRCIQPAIAAWYAFSSEWVELGAITETKSDYVLRCIMQQDESPRVKGGFTLR